MYYYSCILLCGSAYLPVLTSLNVPEKMVAALIKEHHLASTPRWFEKINGCMDQRTTPRIPTWSPTVVLTGPDDA